MQQGRGGAGGNKQRPSVFPAWFFDGETNRAYAHNDDLFFFVKPLFESAGFELQFYSIENSDELFTFVNHFRPIIANLLRQALRIVGGPVKFSICVKILMSRNIFFENQENAEIAEFYLGSHYFILYNAADVHSLTTEAFEEVMRAEDRAESEGSTFCSFGVELGFLKILRYDPLVGNGTDDFVSHRDIAKYLGVKSKAILNVEQDTNNPDCNCLLQCIIAKISPPTDNSNLASSYVNRYGLIDMTGISSPVGLDKIKKIETNNNLSINVYTFEEQQEYQPDGDFMIASETKRRKKRLLPLMVSERDPCMDCQGRDDRCPHVIDLLLLRDFPPSSKKRINHYVLIRSIKSFLFSKNKSKNYICRKCFSSYTLFSQLVDHNKLCSRGGQLAQIVQMPIENHMRFKQYKNEIPLPFACYLDFEAFVQTTNVPIGSATRRIQQHVPCLYAFVIIDQNHELCFEPYSYYSPDPRKLVEHLIDTLLRFFNQLKDAHRKRQSPLLVTERMEEIKESATHCGLCKKEFLPGVEKVYNHRHNVFDVSDTDKYLQGITCVDCNLQYKVQYKMPVLTHNFSSYDSKFIIQYLEKYQTQRRRVNILAKTTEKFTSIRIGPLEFKDSMSFISGSLDSASSILTSEQYKFTRAIYKDPVSFDLMRHKIPFPYTSFNSDDNARNLPALLPKSAFYNDLRKEHITDEKYEKLKTIVKHFKLNTLLDLAKHYVISDTILLADIMTQLRIINFEYFKLDMLQYLSLGSLSWAYMLKNTGVNLELTQDVNVYLFIERGIYGGLSFVNGGRYFESNNRDLPSFDENKLVNGRASALFLTDVNSLYGNTQFRNKLYIDSPSFLSEMEIAQFDISSRISETGHFGYLLEVDIHIPDRLHDLISYFPVLPRQRTLHLSDLSPHTRLKLQELAISFPKAGVTRLIADLHDKNNYVVQGVLLKWCMERLGIEVRKIHRILQFRQSNWLNNHVKLLLEYRLKNKNNPLINKNMKLSANAIFGKSLENVWNYRDIRVVTNQRQFLKLTASNYFKDYKQVRDGTYVVELRKQYVCLNKPSMVGQMILDLSKWTVYKLVFDNILPHFLGPNPLNWIAPKPEHPYRVAIGYSDTDSLLLCVWFPPTMGHYDCLIGLERILDTSDFPKDHLLYKPREPLEKMGLLKIEGFPQRLLRAVLVKSKLYTLEYENERLETKCKGATSESTRSITIDNFLNCIDYNFIIKADQTSIRSYNSQLYTVIMNKQILQSIDYKNYYLNERVCLPHGHYKNKLQTRFLTT